MWGGECQDINPAYMWQRGPGLPAMGFFKSNWFAKKSEGYSSALIPLAGKPIPAGEQDPYQVNEHWPVTTGFQINVFQSRFWDIAVRTVGATFAHLGPLGIGSRRRVDQNGARLNFHFLSAHMYGDLEQVPINDGMTDQIKLAITIENTRRSQVQEIMRLCFGPDRFPPMATHFTSSADPLDDALRAYSDTSSEDDVAEYEKVISNCPRWTEIVEYLMRNRGPCELALDTMTFSMPEPTLYRYIMTRGGLDITPEEFRMFLRTANDRQELFQYGIHLARKESLVANSVE
jgi:hypothetical protein